MVLIIPHDNQELVDQIPLITEITSTKKHGKARFLYKMLYDYMLAATATKGFYLDEAFNRKVKPKEHWRAYVVRFTNFCLEQKCVLDKKETGWETRFDELQTRIINSSWRTWQCFYSLDNTLLKLETVIEFMNGLLDDTQ